MKTFYQTNKTIDFNQEQMKTTSAFFACKYSYMGKINENRYFLLIEIWKLKNDIQGEFMKKLILVSTTILIVLLLVSCEKTETIKLGFVAQLTGNQAELGIQERNGVQLAVEEINSNGGINGRHIELIVKDDMGTEEGAMLSNKELLSENVVAIIGHATSSQTISGLKVTDKEGILLISPTASTHELSGIDDNFFRVVTSNKARTQMFANRIYNTRKIESLGVIYNTDNINYSKAYLDTFEKEYILKGGNITYKIAFSSKTEVDFESIVKSMKLRKPSGILIIANDFDTAFIAQTIRISNWSVPIFTSAWAQTETLINHGGKAVEAIEVEVVYPQDILTPKYIKFKNDFISRFGKNPSFGAAFGYESVQVLKIALKNTEGKSENLKQALLEVEEFEGLIDKFAFDQYGDVERKFYFSKIENGKFVTIK